jgi:hypothetical protein
MSRMFIGVLSALTLFTAATQAQAVTLSYVYDTESIAPNTTAPESQFSLRVI